MNHFLAYDFDQKVVRSIHSLAQEIFEDTIGGRTASLYDHEIRFISSLVYYYITLGWQHRSLGHEYTGMKLLSLHNRKPSGDSSKTSNILTFWNSLSLLQHGPENRKFYTQILPIVYCIIPYLYARKIFLFNLFKSIWNDLIADEETSPPERQRNNEKRTPERNTAHKHDDFMRAIKAAISIFSDALSRSWKDVAADDSDRLAAIQTFGQELYLCLYLMNGRSYELALQLCGFRSVPAVRDDSALKLRSIGWLVSFRVAVIAVNAGRTVVGHLFNSYHDYSGQHDDSNSELKSMEAEQASEMASGDSPRLSSGGPGVSCPLCMDVVSEPTVTPCGHIYCWACIISYFQKQQQQPRGNRNRLGGSNRRHKQCPVCRHEFQQQCIRPIYNCY